MSEKPATLPTWATVAGTTVEPSAGQKAAGFAVSTRPPARWVNWLFNTIYEWCSWLLDTLFVDNRYASIVDSNEVADTIVQTDFDTKYSVPGDTLVAGMVIRVKAFLLVLNYNATPTLTLQLHMAGSSFCSIPIAITGDTNEIHVDAFFTVRAIGAGTTNIVGVTNMLVCKTDGTTAFSRGDHGHELARDSTAANDIKISATWSAAHANNRVRMDAFIVDFSQ